jgi:hypothetical protein
MMLSRRSRWMFFASFFLAILFGLVERSVRGTLTGAWSTGVAMEPIVLPHLADIPESPLVDAIQVKPAAQQAPPEASMPIGNRFVHAEPQNFPRYTADDSWMMGSPRVLFDSVI